ncbi:gag-protease polyprotein [Trifolium repens]|nr:gag-protease polyprotein [Trifolium repens]
MAFAPKGAYNRAPVFNDDHFDYWKSSMRIHINSFDGEMWNTIENGPFVPTITDPHGVITNKPMAQWTDEEKKKVNYDAKAQNILISSLGIDQFYHVSHCESAKEMWDTLVTHFEGTNDVKISKINTLTQEFELFHMLDGESIEDMQQRFIKITNKLHGLGKPISNQDATNKILRCLSRNWQPKVTAIKEANDLTSLNLTTLFGKLTEPEQVLNLLEKHEKNEKKVKHNDKEKEKDKRSITLKISTSKSTKSKRIEHVESSSSEDDSDDEEMGLFVRRYNRYVKKNGIRHSDENLKKYRKDSGYHRRNEDARYSKKGICYECGQDGHYKPDCPNIKRKEKESSSNKRRSKTKKAYVAWESNSSSSHSSSSSSSSDESEVANVCFTTHHHKKKDKAPKKVNQNPSSSYTSLEYLDLQKAFEDLCSETRKAFKRLKEIIKVNKSLEKKVSKTEKELKAFKLSLIEKPSANPDSDMVGCDYCITLSKDIKILKDKVENSSKPKVSHQIDPKHFKNPLKGKIKNFTKVKKDQKKGNSYITCHYCCNKGHTIAKCHARKTLVPKGILQWLPKLGNNVVTNKLGPNMSWGPISNV